MFFLPLIVLMLCCSFVSPGASDPAPYKPVVIVHGLLQGTLSLEPLKMRIKSAHPGTDVTILDLYTHLHSFHPLWDQVERFGDALKPIMEDAGEGGINIICYSQGGVVCRGLLSTLPDHNVKNFIALSSPLMGEFGNPEVYPLPQLPPLQDDVYLFCYLKEVGMDVSVCQYWNDPHHQELYKENSDYLAVLNNQTANPLSEEWKDNFLRIENLVMVGGPDDGVILPWQSSQFGFYDSDMNVVDMEDQEIFKEDYFGLKTLRQRGALHACIKSDIPHLKWPFDLTALNECILPWLN